MEFKINLGDLARDTITGFEGVVTARSQWLTNCNTYGLQPKVLKDGIPQGKAWFDEPQLEIVTPNVHKAFQETGGPTRNVPHPNR